MRDFLQLHVTEQLLQECKDSSSTTEMMDPGHLLDSDHFLVCVTGDELLHL